MQPDPEPGTSDQQPDLSADGVQQDPEPGQPARIRNAGSGDQDNRHREQLRRDPLPEISNQCGTDPEPGAGDQQRDPSADGVQQDPEPGQPARIRNAGSGDQDTGSGSSCGGILCRRSAAMQPDPERVHYERGNNMTEKGYKQRIISNCKSIGTYRKEFDLVIDNLAYMYVRRDLTKEAYRQSGEELVVEQVNKNGSKYATRNPYLTELDNCNKIILELEKELGLTPLAKKKIDGGVFGDRQGESDPLTTALTQLRVVKG